MRVEVLVSTMHQKNCDFLKKMNIKRNAVVINQTNCDNGLEEIEFKESIKFSVNFKSNKDVSHSRPWVPPTYTIFLSPSPITKA